MKWVVCALLFASRVALADGDRIAVPLIEADAGTSSVTGYLFRPAASGRLPAVVLMHGCNGLGWHTQEKPGWRNLEGYAKRYVSMGYVALVLDSFEPRGVYDACGKPMTVSPQRRAGDAFSALRLLARLDYVDPARIVLEGRSHGGVAVLLALEEGKSPGPEHFVAGIAWYPGCGWTKRGLAAPALVLIGDADDWTKADVCRRFAQQLAALGQAERLELHTYPGATHAFDVPGPVRYAVGGRYKLEYDAQATADAWVKIQTFLATNAKH